MTGRGSSPTVGLLAALLLTLAAVLIYSHWMRTSLLPSALRYVPPEANIILASGDIASLWDSVEHHFGRVMRETDREGLLATFMTAVEEGLTDSNVPVSQKADLICKYGVDIERGVLAGLSLHLPGLGEGDFGERLRKELETGAGAAILPIATDGVVDEYCDPREHQGLEADSARLCADLAPARNRTKSEDRFVRFMCQLTATTPALFGQMEAEDYSCDASVMRGDGNEAAPWSPGDHAYDFDSFKLVFPKPDTAILTASCELLDRGLRDQERNLSYARADDGLLKAVRHQLQRPLTSGPGLLVYMRGIIGEFSPVLTTTITLSLTPEAVIGDIRAQTRGVNTRIANEILSTPGAELPWRHFLDADTGAVFILHDRSIPRYLEFAGYSEDVRSKLHTFLGGILEPARQLEHLDQLLIAGTDYQEGLPLILLGLWGSAAELKELVFETQSRLRETRERGLVKGAVQEYVKREGNTPATLEELFDAGLLPDDAKSLLEKFGPTGEPIVSLSRKDFESADYRETYQEHEIVYLEPSISVADLTYRLSVDNAREAEILLENRYRLASTMTNDILWVGMGRAHIQQLIQHVRAVNDSTGFPVAKELDGSENKLRIVGNIGSLIRKGLLSGESELQQFTEKLLFDLRYHRYVGLSLETSEDDQLLLFRLRAPGPVQTVQPAAFSENGRERQ